MENMFSGNSEKQIPKNLSECTKSNATVDTLHAWAERLENWGQIFFVVLIIIGIISTIIDTVQIADVNEELVFSTLVTSIITWALYAFIEFCTYHVLALLVSALGFITQSTIISANVALYEASKNAPNAAETDPQPKPKFSAASFSPDSYIRDTKTITPPDNMWVCRNCGTNNKNEHGQCKKCGQYRS